VRRPGARERSAGIFVFEPSKLVWFESSTSAFARRRVAEAARRAAYCVNQKLAGDRA
jgi:hypothetical protein